MPHRGRAGSYGRPGPVQNPTSGPSFVSPSRLRWCAAEQNLKPPLSHPPCRSLALAHVLCPLTADFQTNEGRVGPVGPSTAPTRTPDGYVPTGTSTRILKVPTCFPVLPAFVQNPSLTVFSPEELKESSPSPFGTLQRSDGSFFFTSPSQQNKQIPVNKLSESRVSQLPTSQGSLPLLPDSIIAIIITSHRLLPFFSNHGCSINLQRNGHPSLQGGER